jgi:NADH pyrophosphatase NudC (nudix superfamily)
LPVPELAMHKFHFCPACAAPLSRRDAAGRERLCCSIQTCGWVHWDNPLPVVAAIVECGRDVLLARNHGWPEKLFGLVSGFLERDETPAEGVLRELREELGVEGEIVELVGVYPFVERNEVVMVWHVRVPADAVVTIGEELAGYKRVPIEKLRPWPLGTGPAVRDWLERRAAL